MFGGLRGLVKHLRSSTAVFVYVLALYFLLMVHQVPIGESGFHLGLSNPQQMISMIVIDQTVRPTGFHIEMDQVETLIAHLPSLQADVRASY